MNCMPSRSGQGSRDVQPKETSRGGFMICYREGLCDGSALGEGNWRSKINGRVSLEAGYMTTAEAE